MPSNAPPDGYGGTVQATRVEFVVNLETALRGPRQFRFQGTMSSFELRKMGFYRNKASRGQVMVGLALARRPRRNTHSQLARRLGVLWLPVTLLIRADELCIGQYVPPHCSLDLRFRRAS